MSVLPDLDAIAGALAGYAELPSWLTAPMDGQRVGACLTDHVSELASGRLRLVSCTPERLRAKPDQWYARYRVELEDDRGRPRPPVVLVGRLYPPDAAVPAAATSAASSDGATAFGEVGWRCWLPEVRLALRVQVTDEALPGLSRTTEPNRAAQLIQDALHAAGHDVPPITACHPRVVRYKPGSRCTVVADLDFDERAGDSGPTPIVLKTHQGDKGQVAWKAMRAIWDLRRSWSGAVELAEPLAYLEHERILVQGPVSGVCTLKELAREAFLTHDAQALASLRRQLARTAAALAVLHRSGAVYDGTATLEGELDEIRGVVRRLAASEPTLEPAAEPLLQSLQASSERCHPDPAVPAHHDFRPAQVLLDDNAVGFIDFDGASMAEPALDLGRFRAKLRDIALSTMVYAQEPLAGPPLTRQLTLADDLCEDFLLSYQDAADVSRQRVLLWETADLFTAVLHAWTKVRLLRIAPRMTLLLHQLSRGALQPAG